jgi:hypothetical protein
MKSLNRSVLYDYVNQNIRRFHDARIARLEAVLGICYGRTRTRFNGLYTQYTGQSF